ncbi:MAG: hypothetical protein ACU841_04135 [Gammaproteobacteria bacterium]
MLTTTKKLKWLFALVLVFGGFTVYKLFEGLTQHTADQDHQWIFKVISEFGLFVSVIVSAGYFHHWFIAEEEHQESETRLRETLSHYIDGILSNSIKRGFSGITSKEFDFSQIMYGLEPGDYVYWLITFDPRFKNKSRELENAVKAGAHFRILMLKADSRIGEMRANETNGFNPREFNEYTKLFRVSLEDVISRLDETITGSLGVFIYDGLPCVPMFIVIRSGAGRVDVYNSFYLTEPVSKMPYLHWESEFETMNRSLFETDRWNLVEPFLDYFKKRWEMEKEIFDDTHGESEDFLYAPASAKKKCAELFPPQNPMARKNH